MSDSPFNTTSAPTIVSPPKSEPDSWGNRVQGRCPACGRHGLFVGVGGWLTCPQSGCPDPTAPSDILNGTNWAKDNAYLKAQVEALADVLKVAQEHLITHDEQCHAISQITVALHKIAGR